MDPLLLYALYYERPYTLLQISRRGRHLSL